MARIGAAIAASFSSPHSLGETCMPVTSGLAPYCYFVDSGDPDKDKCKTWGMCIHSDGGGTGGIKL